MEGKFMFQNMAWRADSMFVPKLCVASKHYIYAATSTTFELSTCHTSFPGFVSVELDSSESMTVRSMKVAVKEARKPMTKE
jgi:hypothetical protein